MEVHKIMDNKTDRFNEAKRILEKVGLNASDFKKYPHEFSGGQRQRIGIARKTSIETRIYYL